MSDKTTVIIHIFNEEYLLPFWLNHHKNLFDHGIVIDYRSTDRSIAICKEICPNWTILTTRNPDFNADNVDLEVMIVESQVEGIKMVLNVTEFVIFQTPLKELFKDHLTQPMALSVMINTPYSLSHYEPENHEECFKQLLNQDITFHQDRLTRYVHNFTHGSYKWAGRHYINHPSTLTNQVHLLWFGFYPLNEHLLNRKLQIKQNIPEYDKARGAGYQHLWDKEKMLEVNREKATTGVSLQTLNPVLYHSLCEKYNV
jgi:hypothetical protein